MDKIGATHQISLEDLFEAYFECRKNKRKTINALQFELDYEKQLTILHEEINTRSYKIGRSIAFIVEKPVKREIFAADFRDRIVHHLIIKKLNPLFERIFIYDSYACRTGRGTHFGVARANRFMRQCSKNYTQDCYILRLDIQGFFMAINKKILWSKLHDFIMNNYAHNDKSLLLWLCYIVLSNNPTQNCIIKGNKSKWIGLPPDKSLFNSAPNCGLPIGNLTSQIFANFYLNLLDHFIKHKLKIRYYGRFVDDFFIMHQDKEYLQSLIIVIKTFLQNELNMTLHPRKIYLQQYNKGFQFLGVFIKPHRINCGKRIKGNFYNAILLQNKIANLRKPTRQEQKIFLASINSYLGIIKHYATYKLRKKMLIGHLSFWWFNLISLGGGCSKVILRQRRAKLYGYRA